MTSCDLVCFSSYKQRTLVTTFHSTQPCHQGNIISPTEEGKPKRVKTIELDGFSYADCANYLFNSNRVLLRRTFFIDPEKTKYVSVGFYPTKNYQPLVEIGCSNTNPIILTDQKVKKKWLNIYQPSATLCATSNSSEYWEGPQNDYIFKVQDSHIVYRHQEK